MYEVEVKVELSEKERQDLIALFKKKGFESKGVTPQSDFYTEAKPSVYGGYDLKRYRHEADKFIYTEKIWEMADDAKARKENEYEVTQEKMEAEIAQNPVVVKIIKDREWFKGTYQGSEISITIDSVKFDHSPNIRYFIEAEIDVTDKNTVKDTKRKIVDFLRELLGKKDSMIEAPGMFTMAMDKK